MVRSNTIVGDRFHANGMVVARIVKGKKGISIPKYIGKFCGFNSTLKGSLQKENVLNTMDMDYT